MPSKGVVRMLRAFEVQMCLVQTPGGVLRYISDGDVRSPFLGLKFAM